jgi:hypothetical protein
VSNKAGDKKPELTKRSFARKRDSMSSITTIVHFTVPPENVDRFFAFWQDHIKASVSKQPGLIEGIFHRCIDPDGSFQFVNVARWASAEQLAAGLRATGEELPVGKVFHDLGVKVSQNNYFEAVRYIADPGPSQTEPQQCA